MKSASKQYSVVESNINTDKKIAIRIWHDNLSASTDYTKKYDWLYLNNPYSSSHIYYLRSNEQSLIVGVQGLSARSFRMGGQIHTAGLVADYAVDKRHRTLGPGLKLLKQANQSGLDFFDFLYGFPNKNAKPVFKRAGYNLMDDMTRYTRPLKLFYSLRRRMPAQAAYALAMITDPLIWIMDAFNSVHKSRDFKFEWCHEFDNRFDDLWERLSCPDNLLIGCRNKKALTWRFIENKDKNYFVFAMTNQNTDQLFGYVISYIDDAGICHVVDFLCLSIEKHVELLLSMFIFKIRKNGCNSVTLEFKGLDHIKQKLLSVGFRARESRSLFYSFAGESFKTKDEPEWYITSSDEDVV